jgi:hypothetical protein
MPNRVPFTAYFRVVPERGSGKRFEIWRGRERLAQLVWRDLNAVLENAMNLSNTATDPEANFAVPGGIITWGLAGAEATGSNSMSMNAVAYKPQFGEFPDQLTVVGFIEQDDVVPYQEKQLISGGRVWNGPATGTPAYSANTEPNAANQLAAAELKAILESAITSAAVETIKLEINGVTYGRGGLHFPRP